MKHNEMVPAHRGTEPEQYTGYGDVPPWAYAAPPVIADRPDWLELRPAHNPESKLEHGFSNAALVFRAAALGFLWYTHSVWWCGGITGTVILIIMLLIAR